MWNFVQDYTGHKKGEPHEFKAHTIHKDKKKK